jgi:hypothetical protein
MMNLVVATYSSIADSPTPIDPPLSRYLHLAIGIVARNHSRLTDEIFATALNYEERYCAICWLQRP